MIAENDPIPPESREAIQSLFADCYNEVAWAVLEGKRGSVTIEIAICEDDLVGYLTKQFGGE